MTRLTRFVPTNFPIDVKVYRAVKTVVAVDFEPRGIPVTSTSRQLVNP